MATDTADAGAEHRRSMTVTAMTSILGVLAAFGSFFVTSGPTDRAALVVLALVVAVQFPIYQATGLKEDIGAKDGLYIAFMTFALWFVTLTILYTAGVTV
jgi:hypothetical protein